MSRIVHFELSADNPGRAVRFYSKVFGWKIEKWKGPTDYWLVTTGPDSEPGINGAIVNRSEPKATTVNTIGVESIDEVTAQVIKSGGKVLEPKMAIPGVGYYAYCQDTEGNPFSVMQPDMSVK